MSKDQWSRLVQNVHGLDPSVVWQGGNRQACVFMHRLDQALVRMLVTMGLNEELTRISVLTHQSLSGPTATQAHLSSAAKRYLTAVPRLEGRTHGQGPS
ncbi:MAG: hypothetical protein EON54_11285 [Alcaligenaceae bacterium]|nr:MAG: hypothetical protein EON54_11285 [Alcaligenaceae bacterium]